MRTRAEQRGFGVALSRAWRITSATVLGRVFFHGARLLKRLRRPTAAMAAYERCGALGFRSAQAYRRAGLLAEQERVRGTWVDRNCVIHGDQPNFAKAAAYYTSSLEVHPSAETAFRRGLSLERCGDLADARDSFALAAALSPEVAKYWYRLGVAGVKLSSSNGGYTPQEFNDIESAFRRALTLDPSMSQAQEHLIRLLIRRQEWSRIRGCLEPSFDRSPPGALDEAVATYSRRVAGGGSAGDEVDVLMRLLSADDPPDRGEVCQILAAPSWTLMRDMPAQGWFPLHWRLTSLGWFTEAYLAKRCLAEWVIHRNSKRKRRSIIYSLKAIQALVFLDRIEDALALLEAVKVPKRPSPTQQTLLVGIHNDLHLLLGNDRPLRQEPSVRDRSRMETQSDLKFSELISGARIAIVGPAMSREAHGKEIEDFDVVVRTTYPEEGQLDFAAYGARTDIVYPALGRSVMSSGGLDAAIASGHLSMVVMRSLRLRRSDISSQLGSGVRINPREYLGSFLAAQFAIQRIVHDVLRYGPAQIKVFNTTHFVDLEGVYYDGYTSDIVVARDREGIAAPPRAFAHDYLADFVFTKRLSGANLIEVDRSLGEVLASSPIDYLRILDSQ